MFDANSFVLWTYPKNVQFLFRARDLKDRGLWPTDYHDHILFIVAMDCSHYIASYVQLQGTAAKFPYLGGSVPRPYIMVSIVLPVPVHTQAGHPNPKAQFPS